MSTSSITSPAELLQIEEICNRFENDCRDNKERDIASYARAIPIALTHRLVRELLMIEWDHRLENNQSVQLEDYVSRALLPPGDIERLYEGWRAKDESLDRIGHFILLEKLGVGSFGVVWKAKDTRLNRIVALKVAHTLLFNGTDRFLREAKSAARLSHPSIVRILDAGEWEGRICIVQEYVRGKPLSQVLDEREFGFSEAAGMCLQLAKALAYSHRERCIHRDIKPQNIMVRDDGTPVLIDFGLAKDAAATTMATRSGAIIGTPVFMSPEQARGTSNRADARSDIYSLGVILFRLLTKEYPFQGTFEMTLLQVLKDEPPYPRKLDQNIPVDLETICLKCLEKEPKRRYSSAEEMAGDLECFLQGSAVKAKPVGKLVRLFRTAVGNPVASALVMSIITLACVVFYNNLRSASLANSAWQKELGLRLEADHARTLADQHAKQAKNEAKLARQVTQFLEGVFSWDDPMGTQLYSASNIATGNLRAQDVLERAVARIDSELSDQPRVQIRLWDIIGNTYRSMGEFRSAQDLLARANECRQRLEKTNPELDLVVEEANHNFYAAWMAHSLGDYQQADELYAKSKALYLRYLEPDDLTIADVEFQRGWVNLEWQKPDIATQHFNHSLFIREKRLPAQHRSVWTTKLAQAVCKTGSGDIVALTNAAMEMKLDPQLAELVSLAGEILTAKTFNNQLRIEAIYRKLLPLVEQKFSQQNHIYLLCAGDFASVLQKRGKYAEALPYIENAIARGQELAPSHPQLIRAQRELGFEMCRAGRHREAQVLLVSALGNVSPDTTMEFQIQFDLLENSIRLRRYGFAKKIAEKISSSRLGNETRAWLLFLKSQVCAGLGDVNEKLALEAEAFQVVDQLSHTHQGALWLGRFATICSATGNDVEAEKFLRTAVDRATKNRPADHPRIGAANFELGEYLLDRLRIQESIVHLETALRIQQFRLPKSDLRIKATRALLDRAHTELELMH